MKAILCLVAICISSLSFASSNISCGATYASGLGHLLKGESSQLGDKESIKAGQFVSDEFYTLKMDTSSMLLSESQSGSVIELNSIKKEQGFEILVAKIENQLYPEGVPSADTNHQFIFVLCTEF